MFDRSPASKSLASALALACAFASAGPASAQFSIRRYTADGGGGTRSTEGTFGLGGTIGQPDAGLHSGGSFTLKGGFWFGGAIATGVGDLLEDGVGNPGGAPLSFRMYPPRPNPVAERTTIAFDLPEPTHVRAALYDVSGRLVNLLADEALPAGKHQRAWGRRDQSGRLVSSGVYFLYMEAGAHRSREKVVVLQ
jgi:hypothetical protein